MTPFDPYHVERVDHATRAAGGKEKEREPACHFGTWDAMLDPA
jgi:hypothetical protein